VWSHAGCAFSSANRNSKVENEGDPPARWEVTVLKSLLVSSALILLPIAASAQQAEPAPGNAPQNAIPVETARKANPVKPTPESIARGKRLYGYDCAMCHAKDGSGKGDVAEDMKLKLDDFTDPNVLKARTDGELYYIIKNGKGQMPPEGDRGQPEGLWDLVNYIRTFAKKTTSSDDKGATAQAPN
jgi:mono/diheme cytochrome c family protein